MDPVSTALANAWLDAVSRIQSERTPPSQSSSEGRTLTDVIESGLRGAGAQRIEPVRSEQGSQGLHVDRLV
jgi:hypothetical protein